MTYTWSHEADIATVNSGTVLDFNIWVELDAVPPLQPDPIRIGDLQFEIVGDEFPSTVTVVNNNLSIDIDGRIDADAIFVDLAYEQDSKDIPVDELEDFPTGANVTRMVPDNTIYKYYKFRIFSEDEVGTVIVERLFTLTVITSWTAAKNTIKQYVSNIGE